MSKKWSEVGPSDGLSILIPGPTHHLVKNQETGEVKEVYKGKYQTIGEAIQKGQFTNYKSRD